LCIVGKCNMRDLLRWGVRAFIVILVLGALWPWAVPVYNQAVASLTDAVFAVLHRPFGAHATAEGVALSWQPLRYITQEELQHQMGYIDRFARQGLHGHLLMNVNALYMQAGVLTVLALIWGALGLSLSQRCHRTILALGALIALHAGSLVLNAHVEFQMRTRYLSAADTLAILQDPEWYLYYGLRPVLVALYYLTPWLAGVLIAPRRVFKQEAR